MGCDESGPIELHDSSEIGISVRGGVKFFKNILQFSVSSGFVVMETEEEKL